MTYNTGNPIGSTDARDRLDNSENMDILENSTTLNAHADRLGTMRKTRKGMELEHDNQISAHELEHDSQIAAHEVEHDYQMQSFENDFDSRLAGMAFTRVGTFTTGATLTDMRQTLLWEVSQGGDGHEYGWTGSFLPSGKVVAAGSTPATTGGVGAGAWVDRTDVTLREDIQLRNSFVGKSIVDLLSDSELSRLQSGDPTLDLTSRIQSLIDEGKPFFLAPGLTHYCSGSLTMKTGAKIIGSTPATTADVNHSARLIFDETKTSVGIYLNSIGVNTTDWAISGVAISPRNVAVSSGFKALYLSSTGGISYGFEINADISKCHTGLEANKDLWDGKINIHFRYCYNSFVGILGDGAATSLHGWLKTSFCFNGPKMRHIYYSNINLWVERSGISVPDNIPGLISSFPTTETPIMVELNGVSGLRGVFGVENTQAQLINAKNFSSADFSIMLYNSPSHLFQKDATRISNVALADQALIYLADGCSIGLNGLVAMWFSTAGYPAPLADPTYFYTSKSAIDRPRLVLKNSSCSFYSYAFSPDDSTKVAEVSACAEDNTLIAFGTNQYKNYFPQRFALGTTPWLTLAATTFTSAYHYIGTNKSFVDGSGYIVFQGSQAGNQITFKDVNGGTPSSAVAAMYVPKSSSTSRSINAAGTVNTNGADYAEYMKKRNDCGDIAKGDVCGIDENGLLTDKFDLAHSFVIKSTNPAYVGGDCWFDEEEPEIPTEGATSDETLAYDKLKAEFDARMEDARKTVDRIAFSGQVPCNILGASSGDYILPKRNDDGSIGLDHVSSVLPDSKINAIGKVWKILDDGRAWVAVIIS